MIGGNRAATFRDDGGVRHVGFIANVLYVINNIVRVFLQRVIHARFEVCLRPIVIDTKPAAHIHILQAGAGLAQFRVQASRFIDSGFHLPDIRDLAAQMKVQQL